MLNVPTRQSHLSGRSTSSSSWDSISIHISRSFKCLRPQSRQDQHDQNHRTWTARAHHGEDRNQHNQCHHRPPMRKKHGKTVKKNKAELTAFSVLSGIIIELIAISNCELPEQGPIQPWSLSLSCSSMKLPDGCPDSCHKS